MLNKGSVRNYRFQEKHGDMERRMGGKMAVKGVEPGTVVSLSSVMPSPTLQHQLYLPFTLKTTNKNKSIAWGIKENSSYIIGERVMSLSSFIDLCMGHLQQERERLTEQKRQ